MLPDISFYFDFCEVQTGSYNVRIIDGGCYSNSLMVGPIPTEDGTVKLGYVGFTGTDEDESNQTLVCNIQLCSDQVCNKPTDNSQCPNANNGYMYTIDGENE